MGTHRVQFLQEYNSDWPNSDPSKFLSELTMLKVCGLINALEWKITAEALIEDSTAELQAVQDHLEDAKVFGIMENHTLSDTLKRLRIKEAELVSPKRSKREKKRK